MDVRAETAGDAPFLRELFIAGSPLNGVLPAPMMLFQADAQAAAHRGHYPDAERWIVARGAAPAARIVLDWSEPGGTRCVDIAVWPALRNGGLGGAMLAAWLDIADAHHRIARLTVLRDNPAYSLYARLGFRAADGDDGAHPFIVMERPLP